MPHYSGSFSHLERLLAKWRRANDAKVVTLPLVPEPMTTTIATVPRAVDPATGWMISPIVAASLCIKPRGLLTPRQAAKVDALKSASPDFTAMRRLAMRFRGILRSKDIRNSASGSMTRNNQNSTPCSASSERCGEISMPSQTR